MKLTQQQIKDFTLYIDLNDVRQFIKSEKYNWFINNQELQNAILELVLMSLNRKRLQKGGALNGRK